MSSPLSDPETWVDVHGDALFRYALLRLHDREAAEEAVQETFLAALKGRAAFRGGSSERTWLTSILKNKIVDRIRTAARERPAAAPLEEEDAVARAFDSRGRWRTPPGAWKGDPSEHLQRAEFWQVLARCMDRLPGNMARPFTLSELEDLSSGEVCKVLDITPTNLWVMLHRARVRLRACLEKHWFEREEVS